MKKWIYCIDPDTVDAERLSRSDIGMLRFGDEFCTNKLLTSSQIDLAVTIGQKMNLPLSFVFPRLNDFEMNHVKPQLKKLHSLLHSIQIVANDLGIIQYIQDQDLNHLQVILGRQAISVPMRARPPMPSVMGKDNVIANFADRKLFHLTNLNYKYTCDFFKKLGVSGMEFDYIPETFPLLKKLRQHGFQIHIHAGNIMVALTRKCHTARLFDLPPHHCGKLCSTKKHNLNNSVTGPLFLDGNAILAAVPCHERDLECLGDEDYSMIKSHYWIQERILAEAN